MNEKSSQFLNPATAVSDAIDGMLLMRNNLKKLSNADVVVRSDIDEIKTKQVTLISGGGSGHEPAHAGYIGENMLSCAVLGGVFASPPMSAILSAIRVCAGPPGVLVIIKNYTGDRLNFGMAVERAKVEGIKVEMIIIDDDCALPLGKGITGGRGVAGTVLVHKVVGAAAGEGKSLEHVKDIGNDVIASVKTLGFALSTCTLPGAKKPENSRIPPNHIELGIGIHGEPGQLVEIPEGMDIASMVVRKALGVILGDSEHELRLSTLNCAGNGQCEQREEVAIMVNNLGGCSELEMLVLAKRCLEAVREYKIRCGSTLVPVRCYVGSFMTSLEMHGVSISILHVPPGDSMLLSRLDVATTAPGWKHSCDVSMNTAAVEGNPSLIPASKTADTSLPPHGLYTCPPVTFSIVRAICTKLTTAEVVTNLTKYDSISGDGDCGMMMKTGASAVLQQLHKFARMSYLSAARFCTEIADCVSNSMGGTSGAIIEIMLRGMAAYMINIKASEEHYVHWVAAFDAGIEAIMKYGGASPGMRTVLDALVPAQEAIHATSTGNIVQIYRAAVAAALRGVEDTKLMSGLAGRSNYVLDKSSLEGCPDPGAYAVGCAFNAAYGAAQASIIPN